MVAVDEVAQVLTERLDQSVSLLVARGAGDQLEAHKLDLDDDAAEGFRDMCRFALDDLRRRTVVSYTATAELGGAEAFVIDDPATLAEMHDLVALGSLASTMPGEPPSALDSRIQMYAVVLGDAERVTFVRKANPVVPHAGGGRLFAVGRDRLRRLEEPAFSFRPGFDLILDDSWVVVLNQHGFEQLFRDLGLIERHIASWVEGITDHLPMGQASIDALTTAATADSRMWRRLREIKARGHLASVDLEQVRRYAVEVDLDPDDVVEDGQLVFDPDPSKRFNFLHLLNEDLYQGFLTHELFEVQRKAST